MARPGRTTPDKVKSIIDVDIRLINQRAVNVDLLDFIDPANELITEICLPVGYTDERLELIERWLSAHFYTVLSPRANRERVSSLQAQYQSKVDLGFDTSHYGQTAMRLDTNGGLARLNALIKKGLGHVNVAIKWAGTIPPEEC